MCKTKIEHPSLNTKEIRELETIIRDIGVRRLKAEMMLDDPPLQAGGEYFEDPGGYAIAKLAYYKCDKCKVKYQVNTKRLNDFTNFN